MSRIRANQITNQSADGAPTVQHGLIIAGVSTFTGSVSIGGTLTYEDVTNIDSIGIVTARGGIHIDDSIVHIGDTNTKIRFPSADTIQFETGGTQRVTINDTTGVNTLDVAGGARADFFVGRSNQSVPTADVSMYRAADNTLALATGSAERVRIDSNGFMGLGTNSPSSYNNKAYNFVISSSGHAGMTIAGGTSSDSSIYFADGTSGAAQYAGWVQYEHDNNALTFGVNATEKVRIPSAGGIELKADGKGIQFPTTQTPTNAMSTRIGISSEMRYYESGEFEPGLSSTVLNGLQLPAFTDASYTRRIGRYVRVGNLVFLNIEILMAGSVTYANGSTSTAPPCIVGIPFSFQYANRWAVTGHPDYYPCAITYSSSGLTNDTVYATLRRDYNAQPRIEITKPGTNGSRQYNSTNFGEIFPANGHIIVSCTYVIDTNNADY